MDKRVQLSAWTASQLGLSYLRVDRIPQNSAHGACRMAREAPIIRLCLEEVVQLRQVVAAHSTSQAIAFRARLILRCGQEDKPTNHHVAADLGCDADTVSKWRRRLHRL